MTKFLLALVILVPAVYGHSYGPAPKLTTAPGENPLACTSCHTSNPLNTGTGKVEILLASGNNYVPGLKQRVVVRVSEAAQRRWGFELTARLNSDPNLPAGELTPVDNQTQVICDDNAPRPCSTGNSYITQTAAGSRNGVVGGASFQFDWTPPANATAGGVTFFVAGNAANGNNAPTGDFIYTSSAQLLPLTSAAPVLTSVANAATRVAGAVSPNSWVTLYGTNLSAVTRGWKDGDVINGGLPTAMDGVSVILTQFGQARVLHPGYISPTQVNFLLPPDVAALAATVQVKNPAGTSATQAVTIQAAAGQMFTSDGRYVLAVHANGSLVRPTAPAAKGEVLTVYGTGLGATTPAQIAGQVAASATALTTPPTATIGGTAAVISAATVVAGEAGLYQLTVQVPASAPTGDQPLVITIGTTAAATTQIPIQ